jgi:hypothetical protein
MASLQGKASVLAEERRNGHDRTCHVVIGELRKAAGLN